MCVESGQTQSESKQLERLMTTTPFKIRKMPELESMVRHLKELKEASVAASAAFEHYQQLVIETMGEQKSTKVGNLRMTVVRGTTVKINEASLKKALGAPLWRKVTKQVLDKPKLEEMVNSGDVDLNVVAAHTEVIPKKAYVSFSTVDVDE